MSKKRAKMKEIISKVESLTSELKAVQGGRGSVEGLKRDVTSLMVRKTSVIILFMMASYRKPSNKKHVFIKYIYYIYMLLYLTLN